MGALQRPKAGSRLYVATFERTTFMLTIYTLQMEAAAFLGRPARQVSKDRRVLLARALASR